MNVLKESFNPKVMKHNNNAPSQGLMLWSANFERYNEKVKKLSEQGHAVEYNVSYTEDILKKMEAFRESIIPEISSEHEISNKNFSYFLMQSIHTYERT